MFFSKISKSIIVSCLAGMTSIMPIFAEPTDKTEKHPADIFPITFWAVDYLIPFPDLYKIALTDKEYARYKDCNFNLIMGGSGELARKHNLKYMDTVLREPDMVKILWKGPDSAPASPGTLKKLKSAIDTVDKTNPALWGYHLGDEVGRGDVLHHRLDAYHKAIRNADSMGNRKIYVNMLPNYNPEIFVKNVNPDVLAATLYPIFNDKDSYGSVDGKRHYSTLGHNGCYDYADILPNFAMYRKVALKYNKLFIPTLLSIGHWFEFNGVKGKNSCVIRVSFGHITDAKLRWQAFSALAYNADGISWYRYYSYPGPSNKCDPGAIDLGWQETEIYPWLKKLNAEAFAIGKILKPLKSKAVYETRPVFMRISSLEKYLTYFPANDIIKNVTGCLATVGVFTDDEGTYYLLVVNRNIKNVSTAFLDMKWDEIENIMSFDKDELKWGEELKPVDTVWKKDDEKTLPLDLAPGDAVFLKINTKSAKAK